MAYAAGKACQPAEASILSCAGDTRLSVGTEGMRFDMQSLPDSGVYVQLNQHLKRLVVFRKRVLQYSFSDGTVRSCPVFFFSLAIAQIFLLRLEALPRHPRHSQEERHPRRQPGKVSHASHLIRSHFYANRNKQQAYE